MHEHLERIMLHYGEALDELMDAQKYANRADEADDTDEKAMYIFLAKQELEHEDRVAKAAEKLAADDVTKAVWMHLKKHLCDWKHRILTKMGDT